MKAAVIVAPDQPPVYKDIEAPEPTAASPMRLDVLAAGLHHVTRGIAAGLHYTNTGEHPPIAGMDGVGCDADGKFRYFVGGTGSMAEQVVIDPRHSIVLPAGADPVFLAGAMNPAMASWAALLYRTPGFRKRFFFQRGKRVLILGATGYSGRMAVQIARHFGASQVIAAGRNPDRLATLSALGATEVVHLHDETLPARASGVDVVLDFISGSVAGPLMLGMVQKRPNPSQPLTWVHVGGMAGENVTIPGAALRAAKLQVVGSGFGAISGRQMLTTARSLAQLLAKGTFSLDVKALPLSMVEEAWSGEPWPGQRLVFTP